MLSDEEVLQWCRKQPCSIRITPTLVTRNLPVGFPRAKKIIEKYLSPKISVVPVTQNSLKIYHVLH